MNYSLSNSVDFIVRATDGDVGKVGHYYFDDLTWSIRYMAVKTKGGHPGRSVLVPRDAIGKLDWAKRVIPVNRTMTQIFDSPNIEIDEPVSREHENELFKYYSWPGYWGGSFYVPFEYGVAVPPTPDDETAEESAAARMRKADPHLRSTREITGCHVDATDGAIGRIEDFLVDDTWFIRYLVVNTRKWLSNRRVLVSPQWLKEVDWTARKVCADLTQDEIKKSPKFDPAKPVSLDYEGELRDHLLKPEVKEWVQFKYHAPPKTKIYVAGTFNNWNPTAIKLGYHGKGIYSAMVLLPLGKYEFKYIVNGEWCTGPDCSAQVSNGFGTNNNCLIVSRTPARAAHLHTFGRMPENESHRLWSSST